MPGTADEDYCLVAAAVGSYYTHCVLVATDNFLLANGSGLSIFITNNSPEKMADGGNQKSKIIFLHPALATTCTSSGVYDTSAM